MKHLKRRTIFSYIYCLILLIPLFSIGIRSLYVIFNKNAYQSYSVKEEIQLSTTYEELKPNVKYELQIRQYIDGDFYIYGDYINYIDRNNNITTLNNYYRIRIYEGGILIYGNNVNDIFVSYNNLLSINFIYNGMYITIPPTNSNIYFYYNEITNSKDLDNVFDYSINEFNTKHGNGVINFFGLLENYFVENNTGNAMYFQFANWCLNYVLLVSCVWILFSVIMWFVNYANYLLSWELPRRKGD